MNHFRVRPVSFARVAALVGLPLVLSAILLLQITAFAGRLLAMGIDAPLCTTGALHNSAEPVDLPLIQDYRMIRLLLNDPAPRFDVLSRIYSGAQRVSPAVQSRTTLANRTSGGGILRERATFASLGAQVGRIDRDRGRQLDSAINKAFAERDRLALESAFRQLFAELIDETLAAAGNQLARPSVSQRAFQYARRMYSVSIEGDLIRMDAQAAADAGRSIETIKRIVESRQAGGPEVFTTERQRLLQIMRHQLAI